MNDEETAAEADARQQLHNAVELRVRRLQRMLIGTTAWAAAMLLTVAHGHGWWPGDAELAYWALVTGAIVLATAMLLPQILTWISLPSGHLSDRKVRQFLEAETRPHQ